MLSHHLNIIQIFTALSSSLKSILSWWRFQNNFTNVIVTKCKKFNLSKKNSDFSNIKFFLAKR